MGNNETSGGNAKGKWILLVIVVAIAAGAYHFWLSPEVRSENYYKEGVELTEKGKNDEAIAAFSKAIELNPKNANAYVARADHYKAGRPDQAIADCSEAIKIAPNNVAAYIYRGMAYNVKGDSNNALNDYNSAIKLNPNSVRALEMRALFYYFKRDFDKALVDFTAIINNDEANNLEKSFAYSSRGRIYQVFQGNTISAIENFTKAIETAQGTNQAKGVQGAENYQFRGDCYAVQGDNSQAVSDYTKAIELAPEDSTLYKQRGKAYQRLGYMAQAEADFAKAQELEGKK